MKCVEILCLEVYVIVTLEDFLHLEISVVSDLFRILDLEILVPCEFLEFSGLWICCVYVAQLVVFVGTPTRACFLPSFFFVTPYEVYNLTINQTFLLH